MRHSYPDVVDLHDNGCLVCVWMEEVVEAQKVGSGGEKETGCLLLRG